MRYFFYYYARNLIWIYFCFILIFGYMLIVDWIPDRLYMTKGEENYYNLSFPIKVVVQNERFDDNKVRTVFQELDYGEYNAECFLFGIIPVKTIYVNIVDEMQLYVSGKMIGVYGQTKGVLVTGISRIKQNNQMYTNENDIRVGDYIVEANNQLINSKEEFANLVQQSDGQELVCNIIRDGQEEIVKLKPVLNNRGQYLLGIWIKDDLAGIGTLTYFTSSHSFGALGHGIADGNTGNLLNMESGRIYDAEINDIAKSVIGNPGKVEGFIHYNNHYKLGAVSSNSNIGIYGELDEEDYMDLIHETHVYPILHKQDVLLKDAIILSEIDGTIKEYDVEIISVDYNPKSLNKQILLKVTDSDLLKCTGGIVQGMSGSPIIQDGKIVGAITHVFVNDPTKGYGIFIEDMVQ